MKALRRLGAALAAALLLVSAGEPALAGPLQAGGPGSQFSRSLVLAGTLTLSTSSTYTAGIDIGGKVTVPIGIGAGVPVCIDYVQTIDTGTTMTTGLGVDTLVFSGTLAGTFTDGSAVAFGAGDGAKLIMGLPQASTTAFGNAAMSTRGAGQSPPWCGLTDSSGNLTLTWVSTATPSYTGTTTRAWTLQVRY